MKLPITFLAGCLFCYAGSAQAQITGKSLQEFKTTAGTVVHVGDTLRLGRGTMPGGAFQYVYIPANIFTGSAQGNFAAQMSNLRVKVKDLRAQHSRNFGDKTVAVIKADMLNGCVDLNAAEESGEIITAHTRRSAVSAATKTGNDGSTTADELLKLKKLRDAGVLTKAEFEAQKAKLLK